jgi:pimeloyl-ACP methyl ester carboxylesterase
VTGEVEVGGLRIAFEQEGAGPPLVLLNGYVGNGRSTWRRQLEELSDEFTVVAWDAPGSGRSSDPPESFRIGDYADCLAEFVAAIGLQRPHLAGLSFGGVLALELYRRHPAVARSLVLASAYAGWAGSLAPSEAELRLRQVLELADQPPDRFAQAVIPTMFSASASAAVREEFVASVYEFHPSGLRAMARAAAEADLRDMLARIAVPTLLVYGDRDLRAPPAVAEELHAAIPGSRLVFLPGAGHICNVETAERFNSAVRDFLRSAQA